jgi:hypothetical protein
MKDIKDANDEGLDVRDEGSGITFVGAYRPGEVELFHSVKDGDEVTLSKDDQEILVNSIKLDGPDKFIGKIYGFENPMGLEAGNLKIDDNIRFRECHIMACQRKS